MIDGANPVGVRWGRLALIIRDGNRAGMYGKRW